MKALVTGASSGIGRDIAKELAKRGYDLILVARRGDRLHALQSELPGKTQVFEMDLSVEENCHALYDQVKDEPVEVLVNNAGFGVYGPFLQTDAGRELSMIDLNIKTLHLLTKLFLTNFAAKDKGYILNVASAAAFLPGPLFAGYYATKAYVLHLTEAIHEEMRRDKRNIYVGALCPGPVKTEFGAVANVKLSAPGGLTSEYVAKYAVEKMFVGKMVIVPGAVMKVARFFAKHLPDALRLKIAYNLQKAKD